MNDHELQQLWQNQAITDPLPSSEEGTVQSMKKKMRRLNRSLIWRDCREWIASIAIVLWYGADLSRHNPTMTKIGDFVLVLSALFIGFRLLLARRAKSVVSNPDSVAEFLSSELANINRQIRLLQTVLWWYILPIFVGAFLVAIGRQSGQSLSDKIVADVFVLICFVLLGWFLQWINQRAVRTQLAPVRDELLQLVHDMPGLNIPSDIEEEKR